MTAKAYDPALNKPRRIAAKTLGFRNVLNTQWPREAYLEAVRYQGRTTGYAVTVVCNGIADSHQTFRRKSDAQECFDDLGPGEAY